MHQKVAGLPPPQPPTITKQCGLCGKEGKGGTPEEEEEEEGRRVNTKHQVFFHHHHEPFLHHTCVNVRNATHTTTNTHCGTLTASHEKDKEEEWSTTNATTNYITHVCLAATQKKKIHFVCKRTCARLSEKDRSYGSCTANKSRNAVAQYCSLHKLQHWTHHTCIP